MCSVASLAEKVKTNMSEPRTPSRTHKCEKAKEKAFFFCNARKKSRGNKKRHPETCRTSRMSPPSPNTIERFLGFPPCSSKPPDRIPGCGGDALSRALKPDETPPPGGRQSLHETPDATGALKASMRSNTVPTRFGCVACANGTAEILICFVCKKVKCVQYTTKITATLHLL